MAPEQNDDKNLESKILQIGSELLELPEAPPLYSPRTQYASPFLSTQPTLCHTNAAIALPYSPSSEETKNMLKGLNHSMFVQSMWHLPSMLAMLSLAITEVAYLTLGFKSFVGLCLVMTAGAVVAWKLGWMLERYVIAHKRLNKSLKYARIPDKILLSGDGIQLAWSGTWDFFSSYILKWSKIRLIYFEKPADSVDEHFFVCIRNNCGGVLKLHTSGFGSAEQLELFFNTLKKRAPAAFKDAPLYLAVQPEQAFPGVYWWRWTLEYLKKIKNKDEREGDLAPDTVLQGGRYVISSKLGTSAYNTRYTAQANDPSMQDSLLSTFSTESSAGKTFAAQTVLIEEYVLPPQWRMFVLDYQEMLALFETRTRLTSRLDNKRVVRWIDVFQEKGRIYSVYEYFESKTIRQLVKEQGPMGENQVVKLALQMCEILNAMHKEEPSVVHGAFTPESLSLDAHGTLKMTSFPVSLMLQSQRLPGPIGRVQYMAPEQLRGALCKQSDIFALGTTLHFMLTGMDPCAMKASQPKEINPNVSETMNQVVLKCTQPDLAKRFENVDMLKRQLIQSEAEHLITRLLS